MKPDQERVKSVLIDSIVIMCQKGLNFNCELKLQGVIGITVDYNESFVIHINQTIEAASNSNTSANPSPSQAIKQEPQQNFGNYGGNHSNAITPVKREPMQPQGFFASPRGVKVEMNQPQGQFSPPQQPRHSGQQIKTTQRNLQMALVPVNKNPPRAMRPMGRGMIPGNAMGPRMPRQLAPRAVTPQQVRQPANFGPSTSFRGTNPGARPQGAWPPAARPRKAPLQRQKYASQSEQEETYEDGFEHYGQPQMGFSAPMKRPRGGGGSQPAARGAASKKARGGSAAFAGQVSQVGSDRSFKLVSRFICDIDNCNASFTMKSNLRRHQKSKHPEYSFADDDEDGGYDDEASGEYY